MIDEAVDGRDAVAKTIQLQPDLMVMDLSLPGIAGIDATVQIRRRLPQQRVLALSDDDSEIPCRRGDAGWLHQLPEVRIAPLEEMLAVKTVLTGRRFIGQDLASLLLLEGCSPEGA